MVAERHRQSGREARNDYCSGWRKTWLADDRDPRCGGDLVRGAIFDGNENLLIESGGPEWLTWREVADTIAAKIGREKIRIIPLPAGLARINQLMARPFSKSVANTFALMSFVAAYQPRWSPQRAIETLRLPPLMTLSDYLDANYRSK